MLHTMIDIETLDTKPSAVVVSIAAAHFDPAKPDGVSTAEYWTLQIGPQLQQERTISEGTLLFWMKQDSEVQQNTFLQKENVNPMKALVELSAYIGDTPVWGNGVGFDNVILHDLSEQFLGKHAWLHWNDRCFRTFKNLFDPEGKLKPERVGKHDARADVLFQIDYFHNINRTISYEKD